MYSISNEIYIWVGTLGSSILETMRVSQKGNWDANFFPCSSYSLYHALVSKPIFSRLKHRKAHPTVFNIATSLKLVGVSNIWKLVDYLINYTTYGHKAIVQCCWRRCLTITRYWKPQPVIVNNHGTIVSKFSTLSNQSMDQSEFPTPWRYK